MHRLAAFIAVVNLLFAVDGLAQSTPPLPKVSIALPADIPSEKVWVRYVLYGPLGGHGSDAARKPDSQLIEIIAAVEGKRAARMKMLVWAPGCKIQTFDIPIQESADVYESFVCSPLPSITLVGQIKNTPMDGKKPAEVRVDYLALWACSFFGFVDCMVPQASVGTAIPDPQGTFEIDVPDFSADPTSSDSDRGAEFQLVLREVKTWNLIAYLEPESEMLRTPSRALKIVPSYPRNLAFSARKIKR
jgi:hypothetical protein